MVEANTGEVKPFDWAFVIIAAYHLSIRHLLTQAVGGLIRINGQVSRLGLFLFWRSCSKVFTVVQVVAGVFSVLGATFLPSRAFCTRLIHRPCCLVSLFVCAWKSSTCHSNCRVRFSTSSTIWPAIWIFSSPSS
uniref:Uncharacterized protein n=1 Tax=Pygocentrus nattereri TaxID=42514 RepID=A0A3B4EAJ1_PYGNA